MNHSEGIEIRGPMQPGFEQILTPEALGFVAELVRQCGPARASLLRARAERQERIRNGEVPGFLPETEHVRGGSWTVAPIPGDLQKREASVTLSMGERLAQVLGAGFLDKPAQGAK